MSLNILRSLHILKYIYVKSIRTFHLSEVCNNFWKEVKVVEHLLKLHNIVTYMRRKFI